MAIKIGQIGSTGPEGALVVVTPTDVTTSNTMAGGPPLVIPSGTTAQRPLPWRGGLRINTDTGKLEYADGFDWLPLETPPRTGEWCMAHASSDVVMPTAGTYAVVCDVLDGISTNLSYNTTTGVLTINAPGLYAIRAHFLAANNTIVSPPTGENRMEAYGQILVNGTARWQGRAALAGTLTQEAMQIAIQAVEILSVGDTIGLQARWVSNGAVTHQAKLVAGTGNDRTLSLVVWKIR